ncbi:hypothetical protein C4K23_1732 [Pseudomonas chlororaphis]|nr:hypothetical protein C4K23_1732 [Pseudomonas chlororaphis]
MKTFIESWALKGAPYFRCSIDLSASNIDWRGCGVFWGLLVFAGWAGVIN